VAIEGCPLQLYISSLIFSPARSLTRQCYERCRSDYVLQKGMIENGWGPCLHTLEGHLDSVTSIAWSKGGQLASTSSDGTIRIWDPTTGHSTLQPQEHHGSGTVIAWSQDGSQFASASMDGKVKIWRPATQYCMALKGDRGQFKSFIWSLDGARPDLALNDKAVRFWDLAIGKQIPKTEGYRNSVISIARSQDGRRLASGLSDK
jgi:WD40 repeat protein